jgi:uncharacterized protein (DUF433 family)
VSVQIGCTVPDAGTETWRFLERRPSSWRRQLYLRGRNMTVGNLVYSMRATRQTPEDAAADYDLPLEQVQEALRYYELHRDLVEDDAREERRWLEERGILIEPPDSPGGVPR